MPDSRQVEGKVTSIECRPRVGVVSSRRITFGIRRPDDTRDNVFWRKGCIEGSGTDYVLYATPSVCQPAPPSRLATITTSKYSLLVHCRGGEKGSLGQIKPACTLTSGRRDGWRPNGLDSINNRFLIYL